MRSFEKISFEQFKKDVVDDIDLYQEYLLPKRGTKAAAGYDFYALYDYTLKPGEIKKIPTGIKVYMEEDEVLLLLDRSSMGFKYNVRFCNQVGVIDADYYNNSSNEGHMWIKIQNEGTEDYVVKKGDGMCQGIFVKYLKVDNEEEVHATRIDGFGSTNKGEKIKMEKGKYYISTAIAYTSGKPHIGNTYEIVLADAIARYKRLIGYDVYFQTGTDEHGIKIEEKASAKGMQPQEFVDEIALEIRRIWDVMNTSYDKFVRTTNPAHEEKVAKIFDKLYEQGDIYKGEYKGLYCTPCESFWTESQLIDGMCPDCGREVKPATEEAYFFKMSKYAKKLEEYIESHPDFIQPESRKNEIMNNFIRPGLQDLCVSRTSFTWGIPVNFDPKHVIYVWIDALSNYITFLGYDPDGNHSEEFKKYWPADVHLIGKDILRFHTIYWPIMLMALDLPLPKQIFGHPWLLSGTDKMSKSKGNIIYADDLVNHFGVDAVRYYMIHEMPFASDGTFTYELLIERINSDLANVLGNLVNRTISMAHKYFEGKVLSPTNLEELDESFRKDILSINDKVETKMQELRVADAIDELLELFRRSNKYIDETTPWSLAKDETKKDRLATVLYNLLEAIRHGAVLLQPFLPETADKIFKQLNTENRYYESINTFDGLDTGITLNQPEPLFARIDKEAKLKELVEKED